jgi:CRISPR type III-A-associated protein Csm2
MEDEVQPEVMPAQAEAAAEAPAKEAPAAEAPAPQKHEEPRKQDGPKPQGQRRDDRPQRGPGEHPRGDQRGGDQRSGEQRGGDRGPRGDRPDRGRGPDRGGERREGGRPGGGRPFEGPADIEIEKLIADSLYLDNQAHAIVVRMRDMDSGTKSQLRRLYNAVRRAVRAPESERQHQFVMLRARLAYTIARHSLRSLDALERLLLQVTRKNDARGYERFKDLFEAIVAYNE